jgi:putative transcriptional regulator
MLRVRLNDLLQERGMSQRELARRTAKHPDVISRFARQATGMVSYELLDCICEALDCNVADVLEYVPDEEEQISLFDSDDRSVTTKTYMRARSAMKAAENRSTYSTSSRASGGAA